MIQNYDQSNFLAKNQQNATQFFTYGLFCCKLIFFGNHLTKSHLKNNSGSYHYIYAYWLQF
jgi:hypothetical protein